MEITLYQIGIEMWSKVGPLHPNPPCFPGKGTSLQNSFPCKAEEGQEGGPSGILLLSWRLWEGRERLPTEEPRRVAPPQDVTSSEGMDRMRPIQPE